MSTVKLHALAASAIVILSVGCAEDIPEDEDVGNAEGAVLAGDKLPSSEVASQLRAAGFEEKDIGKMVCTANYESRFYDRATYRNKNGSIDRGLFQINSIHVGGTRGCPAKGNAEALFDPTTNTKCALAVFKGRGANAWYGYRKHRAECDRYPAPPISSSPSKATAADDEPQSSTNPYPQEPPQQDSCAGKDDGWYCSELESFSSYKCGSGAIESGWQCADNTVCREEANGHASLSGDHPGCYGR